MGEEFALRDKLLIVDDESINRLILREIFEGQFEVLEAADGVQALQLLHSFDEQIAIVLLDVFMPNLDGLGVLQSMKARGLMERIPVILITGDDDDERALTCFRLGISDLMRKPFNPDIVERRVQNVASLYAYKSSLERRVLAQKGELERQSERIKNTNLFLIDALSTTVEFRNQESGEHVKRIRELTRLILSNWDEAQLSKEEIDSISSASALHDIGKIAIPDAILCKKGKLTAEEFQIMKTHTLRGCEILESLGGFRDKKYYRYCYDICRYHHERWDGGGYPNGLKENQIPTWAQAAGLADVYDALTSKRAYKEAYPHEVAIKMIKNNECGKFNPTLIKTLEKISEKLKERSPTIRLDEELGGL